jgi:hypothetical protein
MTHPILFISLLIALAATVAALLFGLFVLFKGGEFSQKYGTKAMQWRVILQATAIILFTILLLLGK